MSDTAPWEDYASPSATGPWSDYAAAPGPTYDATLFKQRVGREPEPAELANFRVSKGSGWAGDPAASGQPALAVAQAGSSGFNAGVADLAGLPMDTAANVVDLGKAAIGSAYRGVTGASIPDWLQLEDRENVPGTSDWIKKKIRNAGANNLIDVTGDPDSKVLRYAHAGGEGIPGALTGNEEASAPAIARGVAGGAAASLTQQGVADAGGDTGSQAIAGFLGAHAANSAANIRATKSPKAPAPEPVAEPPKKPGGFTAEDLALVPETVPRASTEQTPAPGAPSAEKPAVAVANEAGERPPTAAPAAAEKVAAANAPGVKASPPTGAVAPDFKLEFTPPPKEGATRAALPTEQQASNEAVLQAIGLKETRHSAVTGDTKETGMDFQTSQLKNTAGDRMTTVINNEREALRDYADNLVEDSGGSTGTDQAARRRRGQAITAPIEDYDAALEAETKKHYQIADQRAAGVPIQINGVQDFLQKNKSAFLGTVEGKQLLEGVQARASELGLTGPNETFNPATVEQAERLRQYLNDNWTPRTGRLVGAMKNALDEDVTRAAGADVYAAGRAVRAVRATNLEEPKGISKLLAPDDKLGINRQVAHEDVGDYVRDLPVDQFGQVVNVLKAAGKNPAIAPKAAQALNEIRAHYANDVKAKGDSTKGMWNEKAVHQYLADNNANMTQVFTPEEMQRFKTLHDAGSILRMDRSYPGAAAQGHNLVVGGAIKAVEHGGTMGGAALGHVAGAIVGHGASKAAAKLSDKILGAAVEKRIRKL